MKLLKIGFVILIFAADFFAQAAVSFSENLSGLVMSNDSEYDYEHPAEYSIPDLERQLDLHKKTNRVYRLEVTGLELTEVERQAGSPQTFNRSGNIVSSKRIVLSRGPEQVWSFKIKKGTFYFLSRRTQGEFFSMRYVIELEDTQTAENYLFYGFKKVAHADITEHETLDFYNETTTLYVSLFKMPGQSGAQSSAQLQSEILNQNHLSLRPLFVGKIAIGALDVAKSFSGLTFSNSPKNSGQYYYDFLKFYLTSYGKAE